MPDSSPEAAAAETPVVADTTTTAPATDTPATEPTKDAKPADSSPAEAKAETTMLDAVKTALKPKEASPPSQTPGDKADEADPDSKTESAAPDSEELSEDELKGLHEKTRRRIKRFTAQLADKDAEIGGLRTRAESFDKLTAFVKEHGLTVQEANGALDLIAMLRNDPAGARQRLMPIMAELDRIVGESDLPQELQQRVQAGYLTVEDARALMRAHAASELNANRLAQTQKREQEANELRELRETTDQTIGSVEAWERKKAEKDPDWHLKQAEIADQVELAIDRKSRELKRPWFPSAQEAVKLSEDALKKINDRNKQFGSRPAQIVPIESGASPRTQAAPKTMLDVVRQSVGA